MALDPSARRLYPEWDALAQEVADVLRFNAARFPDDAELAALVEELLRGSPEFARFWERRDAFAKTSGRKVIDHPEVGRLDLAYESFDVTAAPGQVLIVTTADPGSDTAQRLDRLAALPSSA